ncbi:MAG: endonuclease/exonuclease/phosphatase family protein [Bacteroidia bacterium]|nr:endonuclease/exonuclease/phosphatase family protein [Bacteroidia bacterium]
MKTVLRLFILLLWIFSYSFGQSYQLVSWNLCNFGKSKDSEEITFIAKTLKAYDIIAIQEVSTSAYGARTVAMLADELNRMGAKWDYTVSDPTSGEGSERYAYFWKTSKATLQGNAWLEKSLAQKLNREPFMARFKLKNGKSVLIASFHAVPKNKNPELECIHLNKLAQKYPSEALMILGDFNLSQKDAAFAPLKNEGLEPCLVNQKTSLKLERKGDEFLANEYDNIFFCKTKITKKSAKIIDFTSAFPSLKDARMISDHVPILLEFEVR